MSEPDPKIDVDHPLQVGSALQHDKLARSSFAKTVMASLRSVSTSAGFVLSVEGMWGSGKTSTLAMIEDLLRQLPKPERPVVVHFNPWLVGDRDALLGQFLSKLASAVELSDHANDGKKVAKTIKSYAKAFDVLKLIPGAEPWATIVKSVFESVGKATGAMAEHKTPDIEQKKKSVDIALREYPRPIIVFIDDIDRLFPLEVFEMVRIIKAVGDLPHVGYVLAWDPAYVSCALSSANVPQADTYLDKVVQVRMTLPSLSLSARSQLINYSLKILHPDALKPHFKTHNDRLSGLYFSGLRELLESPRDVVRVFNTVNIIEPVLRGEVVFSDILGLAALMVKAPNVFQVLRKNPEWFVGRMPGDSPLGPSSEDNIKAGADARESAFKSCANPTATQRVVYFLFPLVAKASDEFTFNRVVGVEGHIAHPARLLVFLQLSVSNSDVSLVSARKYLTDPSKRQDITAVLTSDNCFEFMEQLGDFARSLDGRDVNDLEELCISIARLADSEPYPARAQLRDGVFSLRSELVAIRAIAEVVKVVDRGGATKMAERLIDDEQCLSVAASLIAQSYLVDDKDEVFLIASKGKETFLMQKFAENILVAAKKDALLNVSNPGYVLWILSQIDSGTCGAVFAAMKKVQPTLDGFAVEILKDSFDSTNGQTYAVPKERDRLEAFCPLETLRNHAQQRIDDPTLMYPARAAWRSVVEGKRLYGVDGTEVKR